MTSSPTPSASQMAQYADASTISDWWMVWVTAVGIVATLIIAGFTYRANREAGKGRIEAERAHAAALDASATASAATTRSSEQQVQVLTLLVDRLNSGEGAQPSPPATDVQWRLERDVDRGKWLVRNRGTATAHQAKIDGLTDADRRDLYMPFAEPRDIAPVDLIQFGIERSLASPPATVIVISWTDDFGELRTQRMVVS
jgi:hypothetical protein